MSLVGLLAGLSIANGALTNGVYVAEVVAMWVAAPLIAIVFAFYLIRIINRAGLKTFGEDCKPTKYCLLFWRFLLHTFLGQILLG